LPSGADKPAQKRSRRGVRLRLRGVVCGAFAQNGMGFYRRILKLNLADVFHGQRVVGRGEHTAHLVPGKPGNRVLARPGKTYAGF
jgi:hypothetical protein